MVVLCQTHLVKLHKGVVNALTSEEHVQQTTELKGLGMLVVGGVEGKIGDTGPEHPRESVNREHVIVTREPGW